MKASHYFGGIFNEGKIVRNEGILKCTNCPAAMDYNNFDICAEQNILSMKTFMNVMKWYNIWPRLKG